MENIIDIITAHSSKNESNFNSTKVPENYEHATTSEIPDLFFDDILVQFKLTRIEIILLMYLYRSTWCKPNLHKEFGMAPIISHVEVSDKLDISIDILHQTVRRLEGFGFIETIRSGQYFVRKYFTEELDKNFSQTYDNFL